MKHASLVHPGRPEHQLCIHAWHSQTVEQVAQLLLPVVGQPGQEVFHLPHHIQIILVRLSSSPPSVSPPAPASHHVLVDDDPSLLCQHYVEGLYGEGHHTRLGVPQHRVQPEEGGGRGGR